MNCYGTVPDLRTRLNISGTSKDARLLDALEAASRESDDYCHRHFYIETATKIIDGTSRNYVVLPDILSVTTWATDTDEDGSFDDESWTEDTDYHLLPWNVWPKTTAMLATNGNYQFLNIRRHIQVAGEWGYGDGESATPYEATSITGTVADATTTTITVSAEGTVKIGHTILIETEQCFVSDATADGSDTITVTRGVNGTTAAAHTAQTISVYQYPPRVVRAALTVAEMLFRSEGDTQYQSERIGGYQYTKLAPEQQDRLLHRMLGSYRRIEVPAL